MWSEHQMRHPIIPKTSFHPWHQQHHHQHHQLHHQLHHETLNCRRSFPLNQIQTTSPPSNTVSWTLNLEGDGDFNGEWLMMVAKMIDEECLLGRSWDEQCSQPCQWSWSNCPNSHQSSPFSKSIKYDINKKNITITSLTADPFFL